METSDNWVGLEYLTLEKLRLVLNFTDNESHQFLFFFFFFGCVSPLFHELPPFPHSLFCFVLFCFIIIIFDLDHSQATYGNEPAERVPATLS